MTQAESIAQGTYLAGIRNLELSLVKEEAVARIAAALIFSPDRAPTVASLKKVRREVHSRQSNGCIKTAKELSAWEYPPPPPALPRLRGKMHHVLRP